VRSSTCARASSGNRCGWCRAAVPSLRTGGGGKGAVSHGRKRKLVEPRIAARLTDAYETQRAGRSNGECHRRAAALSCVRLLARESRPDLGAIASCVEPFRLALRERNRRCVGRSKAHRLPARRGLSCLLLAWFGPRGGFRHRLFLCGPWRALRQGHLGAWLLGLRFSRDDRGECWLFDIVARCLGLLRFDGRRRLR